MTPGRGLRDRGHREPGPVSLAAWILWKRPNLRGAACIGHHDLYDQARHPGKGKGSQTARRAARTQARAICGGCPARHRCPDQIEGKTQ